MMVDKICERCGKNKVIFSWERHCWKCQKEVEKERIQSEITEAEEGEEVDTFSSDYVICPYCGNALETCYGYEDFPEIYEECNHTITCPECNKKFILNTSISYYYETHKKGEDNE